MDVAAYLPRPLLTHLQLVLAPDHTARAAASWSELELIVRRGTVDLMVVDPTLDGAHVESTLRALSQTVPSVPIVLYTTLTPTAMRAVVRLARLGVEHVVLNRFDDEPHRFRDLLERTPGQAIAEQMLIALAPALRRMPYGVRRAVEELVRRPERAESTAQLAQLAGMNVRTFYRNLEYAGIWSSRRLIAGTRVMRAWMLLRDPARAIKEVYPRFGYRSASHFAHQFREMTGMTPQRARVELDVSDLVARVAAAILAPRREPAHDVAGSD